MKHGFLAISSTNNRPYRPPLFSSFLVASLCQEMKADGDNGRMSVKMMIGMRKLTVPFLYKKEKMYKATKFYPINGTIVGYKKIILFHT